MVEQVKMENQEEHDRFCNWIRNEVLAGQVPYTVREKQKRKLVMLPAGSAPDEWKQEYRELLDLFDEPDQT